MPRKKESSNCPLPGFDIFEQPLPDADSGVLLKPRYRRKQLTGFVPLWNEFFRCYHLAGVSPNAVYLWAYLRQYEHERREWNAVSDISWPGRRDLADALGVSISHLPNLLNELRRAGLVTFQPVLPGFQDLAEALSTTTEAVRDRAAEHGVSPKVDATLYRTADPYTKTEFANLTRLKYCKGCKVYRYCEGAKDAQARQDKRNPSEQLPTPGVATFPTSKPGLLTAPPGSRKLKAVSEASERSVVTIEISRTQERTVKSVIKKERYPLPDRVGGRIETVTPTVTKKEQSANPSRVKTNLHDLAFNNQPEITTITCGEVKTTSMANLPKNKGMVVEAEQEDLVTHSKLDNISPIANDLDQNLLKQFGFDDFTASKLVECAASYGKPVGYIAQIIQYVRENARQNPAGMVRRLIERGEERLSRADRWQQQMMFAAQNEAAKNNFDEEQQLDINQTGLINLLQAGQEKLEDKLNTAKPSELQIKIAASYGLESSEIAQWQHIVAQLAVTTPGAGELFANSLGLWQESGHFLVVLRNLFDQRRAEFYRTHLERAVANLTGKLPTLDFVCA